MKFLLMLSLALLANSALANSALADARLAAQGLSPDESINAVADGAPDVPSEAEGKTVEFRSFDAYNASKAVSATLRTSTQGLSKAAAERISERIDFSTESSIEVSAGWRPSNGYSIRISKVELIGNCYYVTVAFKQPAARCGVGRVITVPTAAVAIPKAARGATVKLVNPPRGYPPNPWNSVTGRPLRTVPQAQLDANGADK